MKTTQTFLKGGLALLLAAGTARASTPVTGTYVEVRNANVFAGACHFGSEYQTLGRDAILSWHLKSGQRSGADLAGLSVVAVIAGENNLAEAGAARSSIIYTDARASREQAAALVVLAREMAGASLGAVKEVRAGDVSFAAAGDDVSVAIPGAVTVKASRLADRACCVMPYRVWYRPLGAVEHPIVGNVRQNSYAASGLDATWSAPGQNGAFIGEFSSR